MSLPPLSPPKFHAREGFYYYTSEQMQAHYQKGRADALEDAAKCATDYPKHGEAIAEEIRSLK